MFFQTKKVLGLDIGSTSVKLAELDVGRNSATLQGFAVAPTPPQAIVNGDFADPAALGEVVLGLMNSLKSKRQNVASSIFGNSVIVKKISIPKMEEKMIAEQIKWEAEQYLPFDINEVNLDYRLLQTAQSAENMDILLVAAKQEAIFKHSEIVEIAGKTLAIIDVAGFSLAHCFETNYGVAVEKSFALVDVGGHVTNVTVIDRGEVAFCRDVMLGGASYTNEIQKALNLTFEEAETMKLSAARGQAVPEELATVIANSHQPLCEEIFASIEFFLNSASGATIAACFVTGGGSLTPGFLNHLSGVIKSPCQQFDPFHGIRFNDKKLSADFISQIAPFCAVALGLGLRALGDA